MADKKNFSQIAFESLAAGLGGIREGLQQQKESEQKIRNEKFQNFMAIMQFEEAQRDKTTSNLQNQLTMQEIAGGARKAQNIAVWESKPDAFRQRFGGSFEIWQQFIALQLANEEKLKTEGLQNLEKLNFQGLQQTQGIEGFFQQRDKFDLGGEGKSFNFSFPGGSVSSGQRPDPTRQLDPGQAIDFAGDKAFAITEATGIAQEAIKQGDIDRALEALQKVQDLQGGQPGTVSLSGIGSVTTPPPRILPQSVVARQRFESSFHPNTPPEVKKTALRDYDEGLTPSKRIRNARIEFGKAVNRNSEKGIFGGKEVNPAATRAKAAVESGYSPDMKTTEEAAIIRAYQKFNGQDLATLTKLTKVLQQIEDHFNNLEEEVFDFFDDTPKPVNDTKLTPIGDISGS